ncbi:MAG: PSD1 and planctomycete cytochrome C domain-containing protein [Planctomycetota bacterium]
MKNLRFEIICLALTLDWVLAIPAIGQIDFNRQVRPILANHCLQCHGPDSNNRQADLRLDTQADATQSAIVAGKPHESPLIHRIESTDPDEVMPPGHLGKPLSADQITILKDWIAQGAKYSEHWAFEPIGDSTKLLQQVTDDSNQKELPIDRFIKQSLDKAGLKLSPELSKEQFIRRVSFDLTGLPPTSEELSRLVADTDPESMSKWIDRLLESPRYAERWGKHWLDIARYADTHGGAAIGFTSFPFSYTYRDYVIGAFERDLPLDQFLLEQIAADQIDLPENDPKLAALGFLTVGMQFRNYHDTIDDRIDVITRGLMGLTVTCARCHDHKFDPIPTADYYALVAAIAPSNPPETLPVIGQSPDANAQREYEKQLKTLSDRHQQFALEQNEVMRSRLRMQVGLYLAEIAKGAVEADLATAFLSYRTDEVRPAIVNRWLKYLSELSQDDPVFHVWFQARSWGQISEEEFAKKSEELVAKLRSELEAAGFKPETIHKLSGDPPKWNPILLDAISQKKPKSLLELASLYGDIFGEEHKQWLTALVQTSLEAVPGAAVKPDDHPEHKTINSPSHRQLRHHLYGPGTPFDVPENEASKLTNRTIADMISGKRGAIHQLNLSSPGAPPRAMVLQETSKPQEQTIYLRGNPLSRGPVVEPGFLTAIRHSKPLESFEDGKRRLGLARAVISEDNPLTSRVIVNWVWQQHFGVGLVRTPDDFGTRGTPPTHPELLDYIANEFRKNGWSLRWLHKQILSTKVYRQACVEDPHSRQVDPENRLLWRMPRRRLDFEAMRDAMLSASGELNLAQGGRPVDFEANPTSTRRSIYGFVNRDIVSPLMSTFDVANPNACTAKRPETTVPQQTLFALNSEFIQDRAAKIASSTKKDPDQAKPERIAELFRKILGRMPKSDEEQLALKFIDDANQTIIEGQAPDPEKGWAQLAHALLASNEFTFID